MAGVAYQDDRPALADVVLALGVHLGDQRARGVQDRQAAGLGLAHHRAGDAMGAEHRHGPFRDFGQLFDEHRALGLQAIDDVTVMDDLVTHVDRPAVFLQRPVDDVDGANHPCAKAARLS